MKNIVCDVKEDGAINMLLIQLQEENFSSGSLILQKIFNSLFRKKKKRAPRVTRKDEMLADLFTDVMDAWNMP
jgi:hypothetical protein